MSLTVMRLAVPFSSGYILFAEATNRHGSQEAADSKCKMQPIYGVPGSDRTIRTITREWFSSPER